VKILDWSNELNSLWSRSDQEARRENYELIYEVVRITIRRWTPTLAVDGGHFDQPAVRSSTTVPRRLNWALAPE